MSDKQALLRAAEILRELMNYANRPDSGLGELRSIVAKLEALSAQPAEPEVWQPTRKDLEYTVLAQARRIHELEVTAAPPAAEQQKKTAGEDEQVERLTEQLRNGELTSDALDKACYQAADLLESQALTIKRLEHEISARKV